MVRASEIEYRNNITTLKISRDEKKGIHLILSLCKGKLESLKKSNDDMIQSRLLSEFVGRMETNIVSKTNGKIKSIKVKEGEMVSDKQLLMTLE